MFLIFVKAGKFWDSVYLKSKSKIYFYEGNSRSIVRYDLKTGNFKHVFTAEVYKGCSCRQLFKTQDEKNMILNGENKQILIFSDSSKKNFESENDCFDFTCPIRISGFIGDNIRSIQPFPGGRIVTITENGILSMCTFDSEKKKSKILKFFKMGLDHEEEISCMKGCKKGEYLAVTSSYNLKNSKIFLFKVENFELKLKKKKDLSMEKYSKAELSFFQDLSLDYSIGSKPVILAFQYDADNLVVPLTYDGVEICYLSEPRVFHSNVFCKVSLSLNGGSLWSIDKNGTLKKISMAGE